MKPRSHGPRHALTAQRDQGLPMGDLNSADICAEAHVRVLQTCGAALPTSMLTNGRPCPRGGRLEALVIDDHVWRGVIDIGNAQARSVQASGCVEAHLTG